MRTCLRIAVSIVCIFRTILHLSAAVSTQRSKLSNADRPENISPRASSLLLDSRSRYKTPRDHNDQDIRFLQPCEILWDSVVRMGLQELRRYRHRRRSTMSWTDPLYEEITALTDVTFRQCFVELTGSQRDADDSVLSVQQFATLTMVGAKGGSLIDQTNQDRAMILVSQDDSNFTVSGVMDGHGSYGHSVAEFVRYSVQQRMPALLREHLHYRLQNLNKTGEEWDATNDTTLSNAFISMVNGIDKDIPGRIALHGGTTLSIVVRFQQDLLYFINTGDSQSFLVTVVLTEDFSKLLEVKVHFATQLHKPDDPDERMRLLQAGMRVEDETKVDDARVWYSTRDPQGNTTSEYGLAMSRSLGDRAAKSGVIAEPTVTMISISDIVYATILNFTTASTESAESYCQTEIDGQGTESDTTLCSQYNISEGHIRLFVVSATDGLIDYLSLEDMAYQIAQALYEEKWHVLSAAESLLQQASSKWYEEFEGQYRDDMAIAISQLL